MLLTRLVAQPQLKFDDYGAGAQSLRLTENDVEVLAAATAKQLRALHSGSIFHAAAPPQPATSAAASALLSTEIRSPANAQLQLCAAADLGSSCRCSPGGALQERRAEAQVQAILETQYKFEKLSCKPPNFPWTEFLPAWPCFWGMSVVGIHESAGANKFMCGFERYPSAPCIIYSFGSNLHFEFEHAAWKLNPDCEIHTFDPTIAEFQADTELVFARDRRLIFHRVGLGGKKEHMHGVGPVDTLANIAQSLGHTHIDILKIDVEGSEYAAVQQWTSSNIPSVGQVLMEVHEATKNRGALRELMHKFDQLDFKLVHLELNGCECAEIVMVQRTFVPGVKRYPMRKDAPFGCAVHSDGPGPSLATMVRMAELTGGERQVSKEDELVAGEIMTVTANYPCRWTEEFAGGRPVCGLRELALHRPHCEVVAMNSLYTGPDFRRGVLSIAPSCRVTVVQVRTPPLHRSDSRCGALLSPDLSGPAQCPKTKPCCAAAGSWCGNSKSHCTGGGTDFREVTKDQPLFSPTSEFDGPVEWVASSRVPTQKALDIVQASGPSVATVITWLQSGGVAGQVILEVAPSTLASSVRALESTGFRTYRKSFLRPEPGLNLPARFELAMVSRTFSPMHQRA